MGRAAYTVNYEGREWSVYKLAMEKGITPQTLMRRITTLGMSVEDAIAFKGKRDSKTSVYDIYSKTTGEKLYENVVGVIGIGKAIGRSSRAITKQDIEEGIDDYRFEVVQVNCFKEHWALTCKKLRESGADLSRIMIVGKDDGNEEDI